MISLPASSSRMGVTRAKILPSSVDFAAREAVISRLEADYDASLSQIDELNAKLEGCLALLTGKPANAPLVGVAPAWEQITTELKSPERRAA